MDQNITRKYNYWQWRTLIILMIGYLLFYFVRKNFSIVMPALESELGLTKLQLGTFLTLNGIIYGVSRCLVGFVVDRVKTKKLIMASGLLLSAFVTIMIGLSPQMNGIFNLLDAEGKATTGLVVFIGSLWLVNGFAQGMGFPPCSSLMAHWIKPSELAFKQSIWNSSHSIGAGLVAVLVGFILQHFSYAAWQWCFFVPAMLAILGSFLIFFGLKDTPAQVGLPDPSTLDNNAPVKVEETESPERTELAYKKMVSNMVLKNPVIWMLALANFCVYVIRFTILDWGSTFLTQDKGMTIQLASSVVAASELCGGILGTLLAGWATDKYLKSKAHRTCLIGILGATLCFFLFWRMPAGHNAIAIVCIVMSSFFIYMPQALIGISCTNQATKRAAASANGIAGIFGYASTTVSGLVFGGLADKFGWDAVFAVAIGFGIVGTLIFASIWKAPANRYDKAEKIMAEVDAELAAKN